MKTTTATLDIVRNAQHFEHIVGTPSRKRKEKKIRRFKFSVDFRSNEIFFLARSLLEK